MSSVSNKRRKLNSSKDDDAHALPLLQQAQEESRLEDPLAAVTNEERLTWKGFCEIESEPALFNAMLEEFGVKGARVYEVFDLGDEAFSVMGTVFGLIFLFRVDDAAGPEDGESCPREVWFANQTSENSCASVALLNIISNLRQVELGENLHRFCELTRDLPPPLRGEAINNDPFIKGIHNSFARKMDMLDADLFLRQKKQTAKKPRKAKGRKPRQTSEQDEDACYHFIAYVPIDGYVWSLDGLRPDPVRLGPIDNGAGWLTIARFAIWDRIAAYAGDEINFSLLAVCDDPVVTLSRLLEANSARLAELAATAAPELAAEAGWRQRPQPEVNNGLKPATDETVTEDNNNSSQTAVSPEPAELAREQDNRGYGQRHDLQPEGNMEEELAAAVAAAANRQLPTTQDTPPAHMQQSALPVDIQQQQAAVAVGVTVALDEEIEKKEQEGDGGEHGETRRRQLLLLAERERLHEQLAREHETQQRDRLYAMRRRWDYSPFIRRWLQVLIRKGVLRDIIAGH